MPQMMKLLEKLFEAALWNSRFVVVLAVVASLAAGFAVFFMATADVVYLVQHVIHYADPDLALSARKLLHDETISHIVEVVDGYLLATVMLMFSLGLYELFISDIDAAQHSEKSSKVLVIRSLDDLKARLAKVIVMILIVTLFQHALEMKMEDTRDLLHFAGSIALVGLALFLLHKGESATEHGAEAERHE
jgi:uncharacterized membrane protein YqhA